MFGSDADSGQGGEKRPAPDPEKRKGTDSGILFTCTQNRADRHGPGNGQEAGGKRKCPVSQSGGLCRHRRLFSGREIQRYVCPFVLYETADKESDGRSGRSGSEYGRDGLCAASPGGGRYPGGVLPGVALAVRRNIRYEYLRYLDSGSGGQCTGTVSNFGGM